MRVSFFLGFILFVVVTLTRESLACLRERNISTPLGDFHVLDNVLCSHWQESPTGITLTTQFSVDRFDRFLRLLKTWPGMVSGAVVLKSKDDSAVLSDLISRISPDFKAKLILSVISTYNSEKLGEVYPINLARNIAIEQALDETVFVVDVDNIISPQLIPDLPYYAKHIKKELNESPKTAFVLPIFEVSPRSSKSLKELMPRDKRDFFRKFMDNELIPFHELDCEPCHYSTDYPKWFQKDRSFVVNYTVKYEPYVIVARDQIPRFDERFGNYGWSKISWHYDLNRLGFIYEVLPYPFFLLHDKHDLSQYRMNFGQVEVRKEANLAWSKYQKEARPLESFQFFPKIKESMVGRLIMDTKGDSSLRRSEGIFLTLLALFTVASVVGLTWVFFPKVLSLHEVRSFESDRSMFNPNPTPRKSCLLCQWTWVQFFTCLVIAGFSIAWIYITLNPSEIDHFEGVR